MVVSTAVLIRRPSRSDSSFSGEKLLQEASPTRRQLERPFRPALQLTGPLLGEDQLFAKRLERKLDGDQESKGGDAGQSVRVGSGGGE